MNLERSFTINNDQRSTFIPFGHENSSHERSE